MTSWWWKRRGAGRLRRLGGTLIVAVGVVALLVWMAGSEPVMLAIQGGLARVTGSILAALGHRTVVEGNTVCSDLFGISVVTACTGLFTTGLFLIAVVVYPAAWLSRLLGIGIGLGGIFVLNVVSW
jgi:exosortase/archaeosortase